MRIATKFWSCIVALVLGYLATVALNSVLSRRNEALLDRTAEVAFPAAQEAQAAQADFKRQLQAYADAVVVGDAEALAKAAGAAGEVRLRLESLVADGRIVDARRQQALSLADDLGAFTASAAATYGQIADGQTSDTLTAAAARLDHEGKDLLGRIDDFANDLSTDLQRILSSTIEATVRQRAASEIAFVVIVLSTLSVIAMILARWSRRLDDLMYAAERLAQGDYGCEIAESGSDEVAQLARGFAGMRAAVQRRDQDLRAFNETLEVQVRERTRELESRNDALAQQIAERRRIEIHLTLLEAALAQQRDAVVVAQAAADPDDQRIHFANPAFARLLGVRPEDLARLSLGALGGDDETRTSIRGLIAQALAGHPAGDEVAIVLPQGRRLLDLRLSPLRDAEGGIPYLVYLITDVTDRRQDEAEVARLQGLAALGRIARDLADAIGAPVQRVVESLPSSGPDRELRDRLLGVAALAKALGDFAHSDEIEAGRTDLSQAVATTLTLTRPQYQGVADLTADYAAGLPTVACGSEEVHQAVLDLILHATTAVATLGRRGSIAVSTRRVGDWAEVRVCDSGPGLTDQERDRLFDPHAGDSPLHGLHRAHDLIVRRHRGHLAVDSTVGKGTTVTLRIPIAGDGGLRTSPRP